MAGPSRGTQRQRARNPEAERPSQSQRQRRDLRTKIRNLRDNTIDHREEFTDLKNGKLAQNMEALEDLCEQAERPRELLAVGRAVLAQADVLDDAVKGQLAVAGGCTPAEFVTTLLIKLAGDAQDQEVAPVDVKWEQLNTYGLFSRSEGLCCMLGPLQSEQKQRKQAQRRKRQRPQEQENPEEIREQDQAGREKETDKNMEVMFRLLRRHPAGVTCVRLIFNRNSFGQTVENIFSLSFLVKDGRAEIEPAENGEWIVRPQNGPSPAELAAGSVLNTQFVLRLDYKDWANLRDTFHERSWMPDRRDGPVRPPPGTPVGKSASRNRVHRNSLSTHALEGSDEERGSDENELGEGPGSSRRKKLALECEYIARRHK